MLSQTYYRYNPDRSLTMEEQRVIEAGFPYVSTTVLTPPRSGVGVTIDRLNEHCHQSRNTHFVVMGRIKIAKTRGTGNILRASYVEAGEWVPMEPGVFYAGIAGEEGCVFVEGHEVLSPTTATRYLRRGTIMTANATDEGPFTTGPPAAATLAGEKLRKSAEKSEQQLQ